MLFSMFIVPVSADSVTANIHVNVGFDLATKTVTFSGQLSSNVGTRWLTFYLLYPGKVQDDIILASEENPVVSHYGQIKPEADGTFEHSFQYEGDPGMYTLYVTSGKVTVAKIIDTSKDLAIIKTGPLAALHDLPTSFAAPKGTTVRDVFFEKKAELPEEMPVVSPVEISGTYNVFVDAENGNDDTATGSIDAPFKTIKKALTEFTPEPGMVLTLRGGTYPMSDGLALSGVNGTTELPFVVTNYQDEEVTVVGGNKIESSAFTKVTDSAVLQRLNPEIAGNVLVADLKEMGITDYGNITSTSSPVLFVDGNKYTIARYPNAGMTGMRIAPIEIADTNNGTATAISSVVTNGVVDSGKISASIGSNCGQNRSYSRRGVEQGTKDTGAEFCVEDIRPFSWVNTGEIWMYGSFYEEWAKSTVKITELHPETRSIRTTAVSSWGCRYNKANAFYYYNVLEELDAPGEWFVDRNTGKLYIYPISDLKTQEILFATSTSNLWSVVKSSNVVINGISFKNARGRGLTIGSDSNTNYCTDVIVQNCKFENLGEGVYVYGLYSGVINSKFKDINGNGIYINGRPSSNSVSLIPHRLFAQNNVLYSTSGIVTAGIGNIVSHNLVSNNVGSAIYLSGSRETVAEYNEVVGGPRVTLDSGAFYVNGNQHFNRGNHIRYNYIHDIGATGPRALYFDDMLSENYAYGNVCEGWMHVHNGSENTVYNNLFIDHQAHNAININGNYYKGWNIRWQNGSLEYGSVTSALKPGGSYNDGNGNIAPAYAARFPRLQEWATLMYKRIAEYEGTDGAGRKGIVAGSSYDSPYIPHETAQYFNLDQYLRAARDNHVENNVIINSKAISIGYTEKTQYKTGNWLTDLINPVYYQKEMVEGVWRTDARNNITKDTNPFTNDNYGDESVYESLGIDPIPFDKIGLTDVENYTVNSKSKAVSPANGATVAKEDLSLTYTGVEGAQLYTVEVATDAAFTDIISSASIRDMNFDVNKYVATDKALEDGKTYYWRVITTPEAKCSTGGVVTSDTFTFTTIEKDSSASTEGYNKFGVSAYALEDNDGNVITQIPADGKFKVSAYCYNLTDADKSATIYVACYDENDNFITMANTSATSAANEFSDEILLGITAPGTKTVKLFVWSSDGNMIPYSFVKEIK